MVGVMATLQSIEVIKQITKMRNTLEGKLLIFDSLDYTTRLKKLSKDTQCAFCS